MIPHSEYELPDDYMTEGGWREGGFDGRGYDSDSFDDYGGGMVSLSDGYGDGGEECEESDFGDGDGDGYGDDGIIDYKATKP